MEKDFTKLYLENQLCFPLYAASRLTTKSYEPFLRELDITYPQYLVLLVLWQNDVLSVNEIGSRLFLESNTLTPLLKRMEAKGMIERRRSEEDERKVIVSLTEPTRALKEKAVSIPKEILDSFSHESISLREISDFKKTLGKLIGLLNDKVQSNSST